MCSPIQKPIMKLPNKIFALVIALVVSASCYSQSDTTASQASTSRSNFSIDSKSFSIDSKSGAIRYTGDVVMQHGVFSIKADSILVIQKNDVVEKAVAKGSPATFKQEPGDGRQLVSASGADIVFINTPAQQSVDIKGNAFLQQAGISAACSELNIMLDNGTVKNVDGNGGESQCQIISDNQPPPTNLPTTAEEAQ